MQQKPSTQLSEEHVDPSVDVQTPPSSVLLLQASSPGELAGVLAGQVSHSLCSLFGLLLESQFSQTAPDAAYWPAMQAVQLAKGVIELWPAAQVMQESDKTLST